ncbi:MAG: hypothetical protein ABMB14_27240 [Myxococcota bacterium]
MNLNHWVRPLHRWLSIAFTLAVIANLVGKVVLDPSDGAAAMALGLSALAPLLVLLPTGLYLFALPYAVRWRRAVST